MGSYDEPVALRLHCCRKVPACSSTIIVVMFVRMIELHKLVEAALGVWLVFLQSEYLIRRGRRAGWAQIRPI